MNLSIMLERPGSNDPEIRYFHMFWRYVDRATYCWVHECNEGGADKPGGWCATGYARLNPRDNYCYDTARMVTLRRAMDMAKFSKPVRAAIWFAYFVFTAPDDPKDKELTRWKKEGYEAYVTADDWFDKFKNANLPTTGVVRFGRFDSGCMGDSADECSLTRAGADGGHVAGVPATVLPPSRV